MFGNFFFELILYWFEFCFKIKEYFDFLDDGVGQRLNLIGNNIVVGKENIQEEVVV